MATIMLVQVLVAIALLGALVAGGGSLRLSGLHLRGLAYDSVAFAVLAVVAASILTAAVFLTFFAADRTREDSVGFLFSSSTAVLALSAVVNGGGHVTINGHTLAWVYGPAGAALAVLLVWFLLIAARKRPGEARRTR